MEEHELQQRAPSVVARCLTESFLVAGVWCLYVAVATDHQYDAFNPFGYATAILVFAILGSCVCCIGSLTRCIGPAKLQTNTFDAIDGCAYVASSACLLIPGFIVATGLVYAIGASKPTIIVALLAISLGFCVFANWTVFLFHPKGEYRRIPLCLLTTLVVTSLCLGFLWVSIDAAGAPCSYMPAVVRIEERAIVPSNASLLPGWPSAYYLGDTNLAYRRVSLALGTLVSLANVQLTPSFSSSTPPDGKIPIGSWSRFNLTLSVSVTLQTLGLAARDGSYEPQRAAAPSSAACRELTVASSAIHTILVNTSTIVTNGTTNSTVWVLQPRVTTRSISSRKWTTTTLSCEATKPQNYELSLLTTSDGQWEYVLLVTTYSPCLLPDASKWNTGMTRPSSVSSACSLVTGARPTSPWLPSYCT